MAIARPVAPPVPHALLAGVVVALAALATGGVWFYRSESAAAHQRASDQLASIARLKADQIAGWRDDRLRDARELTESPFLAAGVARYLAMPADRAAGSEAERQVRVRLQSMQRQQDYTEVFLLDGRSQVRIPATGASRHREGFRDALAAAWRTRQPEMTDLHVDPDGATPHVAVVAPLFAPGPDGAPVAAIVLISNAEQFLYPIVGTWPIPSRSAETILVRRDGSDALYISDLRHRADAAFRLRIPLTRIEIPGVKAALGQEGVMEGLDYRGVPVIAVVTRVQGSDWYMVAKVDAAEALASWRGRSRLIVLTIAGFAGSLLLLGVAAWQRNRQSYYHALYTSEAELRHTAEALRDSEEHFRALFESSSDAILILGERGYLRCNAAAVRLFGAPDAATLCAQPSFGLSPERQPDGRLSHEAGLAYRDLALERGSAAFPWTHVRLSDGQPFQADVSLSRVTLGNETVLQATVRDITDRLHAEQEKTRLQDQLVQAQKMESIGRLAGGVAHDFNNMLGAILGYTELAIEKVSAADGIHADLVEVRAAAQRSADLTRQLLAFARKQTITPRVLDLNDTVSGLLKMLRRLIGEHISLEWRPGAGAITVKMDPSQVDQVLANLCVNARDAIRGGGTVTIATEPVTLGADDVVGRAEARPGAFIRLSVSDNGMGMDRHVLEHLFEPFFTTKRLGEGTGLGLATVYGIVSQNEGFIEVTSEPGRGTTFDIYLPHHEAAPADTDTAECLAPARGHETVLIVEDELTVLRVAASALSGLGYRVLTANSPAEAIATAAAHDGPIDLLLTDVIMPGMNGRELAAQIGGHRPELACLFMSGYTADALAPSGVLDEDVRFIQKPFSIADLAASMRAVLSHRATPLPPRDPASPEA